ncbi:MAG: hypothetical protein PHP54_06285 [Clostridia bacterium]|jgi:hypothetical protein|nr:hypothetical protein [Clostridia bacterium]
MKKSYIVLPYVISVVLAVIIIPFLCNELFGTDYHINPIRIAIILFH